MTTTWEDKAYVSGVLVPEVHGRLVADIENVAKQANIPVSMLWTSAADYCTKGELAYVRHLLTKSQDSVFGYVMKSVKGLTPVPVRMMALAGACVRNYINAKVMPLQDVLGALKREQMPRPSVLFLPDFFTKDGSLPQWQQSSLYGLLLDRHGEGLQTVVYVDDMQALASEYGEIFKSHVLNLFERENN